MQLSKREIDIIFKLLELEASITTKELAEKFDVSVRTIKYDLDNIREWLDNKNVHLHSQRNKGFWFELTNVQKITLKNDLLEVERFEVYADQDERINRIVLELLLKNEYVTISSLADLLMVSASTIVGDLDKLDLFIEKYQVTLKRKSGQGLWLVGKEENSRLLMEKLMQEALTEYDIYKIMNQLLNPIEENDSFFIGSNRELQDLYQFIILELSRVMSYDSLNQFSYAELLSISLRTTIAVCRMKLNHSVASFKLIQNPEELIAENDIPFILMNRVFKEYDLPLLHDEYEFISSSTVDDNEEKNILGLTTSLIQSVSDELDFPFYNDKQLLVNLFAHLSLRLGKKNLYVNEYNPFVNDISQNHQDIFSAISNACHMQLPSLTKEINESFIAYIALHFLVSLEKQKREVINIVYVCSTGLGVTNLIQQRIQEEIPNVEIIGFASVLNAREMILEKKPDLVVSIFPIDEIPCQMIKVNPIPSPNDIDRIRKVVNYLLEQEGGHISYTKKFKYQKMSENAEDINRETIVKGYIIYEALKKMFAEIIKPNYEEAFLLHVLLMVHRITFDNQYTLEGNVNQEVLFENNQLILELEQLFSENDLSVNHAELTALLQYIEL